MVPRAGPARPIRLDMREPGASSRRRPGLGRDGRPPIGKSVWMYSMICADHPAVGNAGQCLGATHFERLNFSFSRQISSINSVSTTMRCCNVTVHGFV
jgi:hypothetical protein